MKNVEKLVLNETLIQLSQIDYSDILKIISPIILTYVSNKIIEKYTLIKDCKPKKVENVLLPPKVEMKYDKIEINNIISKKLRDSLITFTNVLIENFTQEELINFYNNINTLNTSKSSFKLQNLIFRKNVAGTYDVKKNKIIINEDYFITTIFHELLHLASTRYKDKIGYSGFHQATVKSNKNLGYGINEGYTELLSERYFIKDEDISNVYKYETLVVKKIENIIGQRKMEHLYFNCNLFGLIEELKKYSSEEEIMQFISSTDFILKHLNYKKPKLFDEKMIIKSLKNINNFLIKIYFRNLVSQYQQIDINIEEILDKLGSFISTLPQSLKMGKYNYYIFSEEDLADCLVELFDNTEVLPIIRQNKTKYIK